MIFGNLYDVSDIRSDENQEIFKIQKMRLEGGRFTEQSHCPCSEKKSVNNFFKYVKLVSIHDFHSHLIGVALL